MNRFRPFILAGTVLCAVLLAFGIFTLPSPEDAEHQGFSSARVVKDIEVISQEPHSVAADPSARAKVREYLKTRLESMGGQVELHQYDSIVTTKRGVTYTFDAVNVMAEFPPVNASADDTYLMFVAHYDSRYPNWMPEGDVLSFGAADDGYGLGVTLETLANLLAVREDWKQGVKVLFTDAEEVGMLGMVEAWEKDRQLFDNVGLMINIEARGTYGPAVLFETSPGNEKILDLYSGNAKYPFTYSLTTVVYNFLPNFSDFTIVKDGIPGMNFSTVGDINHYHTDKDNFSNVSERSIQHYGEQILPVAKAYLTDPKYSDKDYFRAEEDLTNFTIPAVGIFNFSKAAFAIANVVIFVLFLLLLVLEVVRGRVKLTDVLKKAAVVLCIAVGVLALGELVAFVAAKCAGAYFKPFGVIQGVQSDNAIMIICSVLVVAASVLAYVFCRRAAVRQTAGSMRASAAVNAAEKHAMISLYGPMSLMAVFSIALVFTLGENLMFLIPLTFALLAVILLRLTFLRIWLLAAIVLTLLHVGSFLVALGLSLTIGAFGVVAMLLFLDVLVLIPLADLYIMPERTKK
jgi:hypothetical protein